MTYLLPVVAIMLGVLVLGESVTGIMLGGIALVLAGVALTRRRASRLRMNRSAASYFEGPPDQRPMVGLASLHP